MAYQLELFKRLLHVVPLNHDGGLRNNLTTIQQTKHVKASTWIPKEEYDVIEKIKGDISVSLWIKRAIRKAPSAEGEKGTNQAPKAAYATESVHHTTSTPRNTEEVKAV